jgi:hypothetical protein
MATSRSEADGTAALGAPAVEEKYSSVRSSGRLRRRADRLLAGEVLAVGVLMWVFTRNSYFFADDFLYLQLAEHSPFSVAYLRRANFGHFAPVTSSMYWIVEHFAPLNFRLAHVFAATVFTACVGCLAAIARRLAGHVPSTYAAVAWWGLSIFTLRVLDWWGASVHIYLSLLFTLASILFFVRWVQESRQVDRWLSLAAFAAALVVQERPLLIPLYLFLLRYVVLPPAPLSVSGTIQAVRRDIRLWIPYAAVAAAALTNLLVFYAGNAGRPPLGTTIRFLKLTLTQGFMPGLVGSFFFQTGTTSGWHPAFVIGQWLGAVILVGLVIGSAGRQRAWRAWFMGATIYLANMVLLASGRQNVFKPMERATDLQYYVEVHLFFCLAFAVAFSGQRRSQRPPGRVAILTGFTAFVVGATGFAVGARDLIQISWPPRTAHAYVSSIRSGLTRFKDAPQPPVVLPLRAPSEVAFSFIIPYDDHLTFLELFPEFRGFNVDGDEKFVVDRSGHLRPVAPLLRESAYHPIPFEVSGPVRQQPVDSGAGRCVVPEAGTTVSVPLQKLTSGEALFVGIDYSSELSQKVRLAQDLGNGELAYNSWPQQLPAGSHVAYLRLEKGTARHVFILDLAPGSKFCMRGLDVVSLLFSDHRDREGRCPGVGQFGEELPVEPCGGRFRQP